MRIQFVQANGQQKWHLTDQVSDRPLVALCGLRAIRGWVFRSYHESEVVCGNCLSRLLVTSDLNG